MGKRKKVHNQMPTLILYVKEEAFSFSAWLCSSWSITIECKHRLTLAKTRPILSVSKAKLLICHNSDIVSITSKKRELG